MTQYILRRLLLMIPVAFLVTVGVFVLVRMAPGDPALAFAGEDKSPAVAHAADAIASEPIPMVRTVTLNVVGGNQAQTESQGADFHSSRGEQIMESAPGQGGRADL